MSMKEDALYRQAMKRVDELVEEVFNTCEEVADQNHYEKAWVLDKFREKFTKVKKQYE